MANQKVSGIVITPDMKILNDRVRGKMGKYEELDTSTVGKRVIYRKLENLNPEISDTYHDPDKGWYEEFTDVPLNIKDLKPRMHVEDETGGINPLGLGDGLIIGFTGTCAGERGMTKDGSVITVEEAEEMAEISNTDDAVKMFNLWEFRITKLVRTNGPELTLRAYKSEEERRSENESAIVDSVEKAFLAMADRMGNSTNALDAPTGGDLASQLKNMDEIERAQLFQRIQLETENDHNLVKE